MTSRFQQRKKITTTSYHLHIQREQTICQKRTEQKIANKRKKIIYSIITTDLLTGYTHTLCIYRFAPRKNNSEQLAIIIYGKEIPKTENGTSRNSPKTEEMRHP